MAGDCLALECVHGEAYRAADYVFTASVLTRILRLFLLSRPLQRCVRYQFAEIYE
jgi:hypothetical protein